MENYLWYKTENVQYKPLTYYAHSVKTITLKNPVIAEVYANFIIVIRTRYMHTVTFLNSLSHFKHSAITCEC